MGYLKIDENIVESYKSIKPNSLYWWNCKTKVLQVVRKPYLKKYEILYFDR
jgi:hypothetical protein